MTLWLVAGGALTLFALAVRRGLFRLPPPLPTPVTGLQLSVGYSLYVLVLFAYSLLYPLWSTWALATSWMHFFYLTTLTIVLLLFLRATRLLKPLFPARPFLRESLLYYLVITPCVYLTYELCDRIAHNITSYSTQEQSAVVHLKSTLDQPWLFCATALAVIVLAPFVEELLFRGLLQNWLRHYMSRLPSITITAICFAAAHYSDMQGGSNIALLTALFVFALALGHLYEKQRTLFAPIVLHALFNAMNTLGLLLS